MSPAERSPRPGPGSARPAAADGGTGRPAADRGGSRAAARGSGASRGSGRADAARGGRRRTTAGSTAGRGAARRDGAVRVADSEADGSAVPGPVDGSGTTGGGWVASAGRIIRRRFDGTHEVDAWGLDLDLVELLSPAFALRWGVEVQWPERIPTSGPAVLVHNRVVGLSEPVALARGVRQATGRPVRTAGLVDRAPVATLGRALGAVVDRPEELTAVLRSGALVGLPLDRDVRPRRAGDLSLEALAPALATGAAVIPVALVGREVGRRWRVLVGEAIDHPPGQGPLAVADLVDAARAGVQDLLDSAR